MQPVTVYTKPLCPYCYRAIGLLKKKQAQVTEISVAFDRAKKAEMVQRANGEQTFPQIFIGEMHIGGCDELFVLERAGKLDALLQGEGA